jgi:hypothetical protein
MPLNNPINLETFIHTIQWQDLPLVGGWTTTVTGSGSVGFGVKRMTVLTGTTAGSTALARTSNNNLLRINDGFYINWANRIIIHGVFVFSAGNGYARLVLGKDPAAGIGNPVNKSVGFLCDGNALKGLVHNGTSLTIIDLATTVTTDYAVAITVVSANGNVEWFMNGVSKGSTVAGPSGDGPWNQTVLQLEADNGVNAYNKYIGTGNLKLYVKY